MKKIMFNDHYGLTQAVLEGRKTMTRRLVPEKLVKAIEGGVPGFAVMESKYKVGEVVAVAQNLKDMGYNPRDTKHRSGEIWGLHCAAWTNKMFVCASECKHHIRITNVRVERLQDISDEDCLREGIYNWKDAIDCPEKTKNSKVELYGFDGSWDAFQSPRNAFAALIDKVSGKGTWDGNSWVFVYSFELCEEGEL